MNQEANGKMGASAGLEMNQGIGATVKVSSIYHVECIKPDGSLRWEETVHNTVVTEGLNELLDRLVKNVPANVNWFVGLKDTGSVVAGDTMSSHSGWAELSAIYSNGTRPAYTAGTISAGSVDNSASKASFSITSTDDVYGAFLTDNSTKGGSTGKLYGAANFSGARSVQNGDTLNVTITLSVTAS